MNVIPDFGFDPIINRGEFSGWEFVLETMTDLSKHERVVNWKDAKDYLIKQKKEEERLKARKEKMLKRKTLEQLELEEIKNSSKQNDLQKEMEELINL